MQYTALCDDNNTGCPDLREIWEGGESDVTGNISRNNGALNSDCNLHSDITAELAVDHRVYCIERRVRVVVAEGSFERSFEAQFLAKEISSISEKFRSESSPRHI